MKVLMCRFLLYARKINERIDLFVGWLLCYSMPLYSWLQKRKMQWWRRRLCLQWWCCLTCYVWHFFKILATSDMISWLNNTLFFLISQIKHYLSANLVIKHIHIIYHKRIYFLNDLGSITCIHNTYNAYMIRNKNYI